ncbi:hypothetical protein niasHS_017405 [Heterodera schachtii]|uniref:fumarate reductase (NADH) n=1 Tax=Heterodera schachtii TaxID=97005 RepID=A0ABD2I4R7_HETSC
MKPQEFSGADNEQPSPSRQSIIGVKRKFSSIDYASSNSPVKVLPSFTSTFLPDLSNAQVLKPKPTNVDRLPLSNEEFITPTQPKKQQSRPNSPANGVSKLILPRSRVASIRRESDCNSEKGFGEAEAAHEKMVKSAQQVAMGFEDFCLDDKAFEERKRAKSLSEPICIFTNAFLPQCSSPSPSRGSMDGQKQCYSPSAQQVVRSNLAYSPSPSPTPSGTQSMHRMSMESIFCLRLTFLLFIGAILATDSKIEMEVQPQPLDPSFSAEKAPKKNEPIIVVGGGLAGMSATLEALNNGAKVILIDKEPTLGGNSAKASSGINGCGTKVQEKLGIDDTTEKFYSDTMAAGDRENDPGLVDLLVHESASAIDFLTENGVDLADINLCGGHSVPRTHWLLSPKEGKPLPVGVAIIRTLNAKLEEWKARDPERLKIILGTAILGLVTWNEYVTGVRIRGGDNKIMEINGKAVILTTGGFSSDRDNETSLLVEFAPSVLPLPTTNGPFATGDGVKMARAMGAGLVGMGKVQIHPTAFVDPKNPTAHTKFLAAEALRGKGAILVNEKGQRFGNELGRRDYLTEKMNKNCARQKSVADLPVAWMLMNDQMADSFGRPAFNFYAKIKGFFTHFANVDELAAEIGCSGEMLRKTLAEYNEYAEMSTKSDKFVDPFGRKNFPFKFNLNDKIYAARVTPAIHYTMGGLQIDKKAVVFNEFMGRPFQGLLAAGEVTGGVHGNNRLAGNSLLECVVFGRISGRSAAEIDYQGAVGIQSAGENNYIKRNSEEDERGEL